MDIVSNPTNSPSGDGNSKEFILLQNGAQKLVQPYQFPVRGRKLPFEDDPH